ncbi:hypothetical protein Cni_G04816 [Canna indica]|uniref:Lipoyl-binding domain-containing protein n=1 Tax=Canna indica TaxID=4628 RepID=A0AAQ3JTN3_9LILI|nr:hypothetical protein Cni_G04816 [Canna indica]
MELAPFRPQGSIQVLSHAHSSIEKIIWAPAPCSNYAWRRNFFPQSLRGQTRKGSLLKTLKVSEATTALTSNSVTLDKGSQGPVEKTAFGKSTFPNGLETLISTVCDETSIAELKMKVGNFEVHMRRDIGMSEAVVPPVSTIVSPTTAPPIPSEPMSESTTATQLEVPKESAEPAISPFSNISSKALKLAALEASSSNAYVLISSPTVGTFRSGRTLKGRRQPPSCKEGDMIKEGQIVGFLDQFENELPIRSDVAGEVLKILCKDGEPVGYNDPLFAILPSFPGIGNVA